MIPGRISALYKYYQWFISQEKTACDAYNAGVITGSLFFMGINIPPA